MTENNTSNSAEQYKHIFNEGETYVLNIPPSWIICGTVQAVTDKHLVLKDAVYVESMNDGASALGSPAMATTPAELKKAIQRSYPLKDGTAILLDGILIAAPANRDMKPLVRDEEAQAIKKAGR